MPKPKTIRKKRPIADPCSTHPQWSMARYRTFIRSAMRRAWMKWPPRYEALRLARRPYVGPNKRQKFEFQCAHCKCWHMQKEVSVDHITPWGYIWESTLMDAWSRLLVAVSQLQVLCKPCHDRKTESEAVMK
jgi:5-methylcytosine-specific restriction endonuclease McrA